MVFLSIDKVTYQTQIFDSDQSSYFEAAKLFYRNFEAHPYRTIGYPLFLGLPELLGMQAPYGYWPIILNIIFLIGIIGVFLIIEKELKIPVALFTAISLALCFGFIKNMRFALTETGFSFFLLLALLKLYQLLTQYKPKGFFYFFFFMGVATLFRPGFYLFTLAMVPLFIFYQFLFKKLTVKGTILIFLALMLTLGVQSFMMKKSFDTFRLSYIDDLAWYRYSGALSSTIHNQNCFSNDCFRREQFKRDRIIENLSEEEMSAIAKEDRKDILMNKTKSFYKAMKVVISANLLSGCVKEDKNIFLHHWTLTNNLMLSLLPILLYGIFILIPRLRKSLSLEIHIVFLFILFYIFYTIITSAISSQQGDRFHIVFYPVSLLLISILLKKIRTQ